MEHGVDGTSAGERAGADLALCLETMPAAFGVLDGDWRFRYVNAEAERLLGRPRAELVGASLWQALPGVVGTVVESTYRAAVDSGQPVSFEVAHPGAPGGWCEVRAWPGPGGLAVYLLDVTERRHAEDTARRAVAHAALLAEVRAELSGARDTESALGRLARLVVPTLTDGCIVTMVDRDGRARDVGSWHADPARRALMERYAEVRLDALPGSSPVARALDAGTPLTETAAAVLDLMGPGPARDLMLALGSESVVVLPLLDGARPVGVLTLYLDAGRVVDDEEMETAWLVAAQAGRAVARVHQVSQQAQLAEELQRSLLTRPPDLGETDVVVRYVPAAEAARVGGDWYDAFHQRDGVPVLVIGDVVGHDTAAAAAMGQLRGLLRGIAHYSDAGPAEVLRGLDEAICDMHTDTLASAAVARLEKSEDDPACRLRWTNAGHPPPMLLTADGTVTVLGGLRGDLLLGVDPTADRAETVVPVPPGSTVLLYTDGLVERRGSTLDAGLDRLAGQLRALRHLPLEQFCDALLDGMLQGTPQDDVAIVAVRVAECSGTPSVD